MRKARIIVEAYNKFGGRELHRPASVRDIALTLLIPNEQGIGPGIPRDTLQRSFRRIVHYDYFNARIRLLSELLERCGQFQRTISRCYDHRYRWKVVFRPRCR